MLANPNLDVSPCDLFGPAMMTLASAMMTLCGEGTQASHSSRQALGVYPVARSVLMLVVALVARWARLMMVVALLVVLVRPSLVVMNTACLGGSDFLAASMVRA